MRKIQDVEVKEIPGTKGFLANLYGKIFSPDMEERNQYVNGDGYLTSSVQLEDGRWVTFGVHRLSALTFHAEEQTTERNQVNHRNGDIKDNFVFNVEWVTATENNIHSEIMRLDNQYPTIVAYEYGKPVALYKNAREAANKYIISVGEVWDSIKESKELRPKYPMLVGVSFRHRPHNGKIPEELHKRGVSNGQALPIKTLDIDTGDIRYFPSMADAAEVYKTSPSHLYQSIPRGKNVRVFQKKYQVAYADDDFPIISVEDIEKAKRHGPRDVYAYNCVTKEATVYSSAKEFIADTNLSKKAVTTTLAKGEIRKIGLWVFVYVTDENMVKMKAYLDGPATS